MGRGLGPAPGTQFTILWQQRWPEQKTECPRQRDASSDPQDLFVLFFIYRLTSYYSETFHFKAFFGRCKFARVLSCLCDIWCVLMCVCVQKTILTRSAAEIAGQLTP